MSVDSYAYKDIKSAVKPLGSDPDPPSDEDLSLPVRSEHLSATQQADPTLKECFPIASGEQRKLEQQSYIIEQTKLKCQACQTQVPGYSRAVASDSLINATEVLLRDR